MNDFFKAYVGTFLTGLSDFAHITAAVGTEECDTAYITISQHLDVDGRPLFVALSASVDAFYALASGYSGVSLDGMDELAVDAIGELFNVINGHFSSRMRARNCAVSIVDPPQHDHGAAVPPAPVLAVPITSTGGAMQLFASHEEFLTVKAHENNF